MTTKKKLSKKPDSSNNFNHDLRTPLTVMRLNVELIKKSSEYKNMPKVRKFAETIDKEIDRILKIISSYK